MDTLTLRAEPRETGKAAVKATRKAGLVPCVLYGVHTEPVHFAVPKLALRPLIHTAENYRVALHVGGDSHDAILKEVAFHPVTDAPLHVDFQALTRGESLTLTVPVQLTGEAPGVKAGGELVQALLEVEVRSLPKDIPGHVSVDISAMEIGDTLHVSDLPATEGVEILTDPSRTIVSLSGKKDEELPEDALPEDGAEALTEEADGSTAADDVPATEA